MPDGPLHGTTIAEFGNLIAAPYAGMLLADLGARVIKVEPPGGDLGRHFGPFQNDESAFFMAVNRGKESLAVDTRSAPGRQALESLVGMADVVLHNLRHGAMQRLGLGYEAVRALNPSTIYAEVSAFGSTGPYAERSGIDIVFQGESGMISISGEEEDGPRKTATTIGDYVAGTNAALAIAAALAESPRRSRRIDVSLRDGVMAVQSGWNAIHFATGEQPERTGTASPFLAPNQVFQAADGPFTLAIVSDRHFDLMCESLGRSDLVSQYPTNDIRMANRKALASEMEDIFGTMPAEHWVELFDRAGLPCGRVLTLAEAFEDPQARHHEMMVEVEHQRAGLVRTTGSPIRVDSRPARSLSPPPLLGEHTRTLLIELGVDTATAAAMVTDGTAVSP